MSLVFNDSNHSYTLDGAKVKSVTGLIEGGVPKSALIWWSAVCAGEWAAENKNDLATMTDESIIRGAQREHLRRRDEAALQGTAVHDLAEQLHDTGEVSVSDPLAESFIRGYVEWMDVWEFEVELFERIGASREHQFSGKFDLIGRSPYLANGELVMVDIKTSRSVHGEVALQLAAYSNLEFYIDAFDSERPMPEIHGTYCLHVTPEHREGAAYRYKDAPLGTSVYEIANTPRKIREHFEWFKAAMATAKAEAKRGRAVKQPLQIPG